MKKVYNKSIKSDNVKRLRTLKGAEEKKILLAGIGTVAVTAEKSKDVLDELVKKGELTVEQGKVLNEELKHNIKKTVKDSVNVSVKASSPEELTELLGKMTPEQLADLKEAIAKISIISFRFI